MDLTSLNPGQLAAVQYCDGPQLVIAGAGSGKTRVLTYKIAYLLEHGYKPWSIMALTFTNKAAGEMRDRVAAMVGEQAKYLYMGTFHSIFARLLRREATLLGYTPNYTIYDEADEKTLINSILSELNADTTIYKPAAVINVISQAKNRLVDCYAYAADRRTQEINEYNKRPLLATIYKMYTERCRKSNAMDFDDLLLLTYQLFERFPEVRKRYATLFEYILVDEYQDTNHAQHCIIRQLSEVHNRVCVVGDDAQSIYAFRGADIDNILEFNNSLSSAKLFKLEQNYRSTQRIVEAANSLIRKNSRRIDKTVFSENAEGECLQLHETHSDIEETIVVAKEIHRLRRTDRCNFSDFAILYRTNAQSRQFEEEFRKQGIPYRIYGGLSFYQRKEIKDTLAYFRLAVNPSDDEAFRRIVNVPTRGIGATTVNKVVEMANTANVSLLAIAANPEQYGLQTSKGITAKLIAFASMMQDFAERVNKETAYTLGLEIISRSGIKALLSNDDSIEGRTRRENLDELLNSLSDYVAQAQEEGKTDAVSLGHYLQVVSLITDADKEDKNADSVRLMTVHAAKGLEFPTVFIVGMEENLFPSERCFASKREFEEERRLFYVAITRAERHCIITYAKSRYRYGQLIYCNPSRFIADIDPNLVERRGGFSSPSKSRAIDKSRLFSIIFSMSSSNATDKLQKPSTALDKPRPASTPSSSHSTNANQTVYPPNTRICHERFGKGVILRCEGEGENTKITVRFDNAGEKQLLVKFARFTVL